MDFSLTDEQRMFKESVIKFARKELRPGAQECELKAEFHWKAWKKMGEFGLLGLHLPEELGGGDADGPRCSRPRPWAKPAWTAGSP